MHSESISLLNILIGCTYAATPRSTQLYFSPIGPVYKRAAMNSASVTAVPPTADSLALMRSLSAANSFSSRGLRVDGRGWSSEGEAGLVHRAGSEALLKEEVDLKHVGRSSGRARGTARARVCHRAMVAPWVEGNGAPALVAGRLAFHLLLARPRVLALREVCRRREAVRVAGGVDDEPVLHLRGGGHAGRLIAGWQGGG